MTKPKAKDTEKVMVYHGGASHEYGEPCEICEQMFRENPYGKIVIEKERQRARERFGKLKVIDPPEDVENMKTRGQAFIAGQIYVLVRIRELIEQEE